MLQFLQTSIPGQFLFWMIVACLILASGSAGLALGSIIMQRDIKKLRKLRAKFQDSYNSEI